MKQVQRNACARLGGFAWLVVVALACDSGGGPRPPDCTAGETDTQDNSCGICETGTSNLRCSATGVWEVLSCTDPLDADGDTVPNMTCDDLPGGCCVPRRDCNDADPTLFPETFECVAGSAPEACTLSCGTSGTRTCSSACAWRVCDVGGDICNSRDDDCDTETDEDMPCTPGETVTCTTTCGTQGSGACTAACVQPPASGCTPPAESCNGRDDDCDTVTDNGC